LSGCRFELSPSWSLAAVIVGLHALAAGCVLAVLPGMAGAALAAALLALGMAAAWSRALLGSRRSARVLELADLQGIVELRSGERLSTAAGKPRYVHRLMVTLPAGHPFSRTILVTRGMLSEESFRRLRVWALWGRLP
jgi:hypothetical protein